MVWSFTRTEVLSAIWRQHRSGLLTKLAVTAAETRIAKFATRWAEVVAVDLVRDEAERLLRRYPLRAADSLQLGAACVWAEGRPRSKEFVALDEELVKAAQGEGFATVIPTAK